MTTLPGRWALQMRTPIGSLQAEMTFALDPLGPLDPLDRETLVGSATGTGETVEIREIRVVPNSDGNGERVTWSQTITRPLRLHLDFDVVLDGDQMHGHSRAGRLPRSKVTGRRITP